MNFRRMGIYIAGGLALSGSLISGGIKLWEQGHKKGYEQGREELVQDIESVCDGIKTRAHVVNQGRNANNDSYVDESFHNRFEGKVRRVLRIGQYTLDGSEREASVDDLSKELSSDFYSLKRMWTMGDSDTINTLKAQGWVWTDAKGWVAPKDKDKTYQWSVATGFVDAKPK